SLGSAGESATAPPPPAAPRLSLGGRRERTSAYIPVFAIDEARVAEAGPDGEDAPALHIAHERHLAQALHDGVGVQQHGRLVLADGGDLLAQRGRKVEAPAGPVAAREILRAAIDRAVLLDPSRAADADERRDLVPFLARIGDEPVEHFGELLHRLV